MTYQVLSDGPGNWTWGPAGFAGARRRRSEPQWQSRAAGPEDGMEPVVPWCSGRLVAGAPKP